MGGKCFVDTDILVYAHDRSAGVKHLRAQMLLEQLWTSGWAYSARRFLKSYAFNFVTTLTNLFR